MTKKNMIKRNENEYVFFSKKKVIFRAPIEDNDTSIVFEKYIGRKLTITKIELRIPSVLPKPAIVGKRIVPVVLEKGDSLTIVAPFFY